MEFEYLEFRWGEYVGDRARRLSSWLVENGYQSLQEEWRETAQRYLPLPASPAPGAPQEARTADVLIPPRGSSSARGPATGTPSRSSPWGGRRRTPAATTRP